MQHCMELLVARNYWLLENTLTHSFFLRTNNFTISIHYYYRILILLLQTQVFQVSLLISCRDLRGISESPLSASFKTSSLTSTRTVIPPHCLFIQTNMNLVLSSAMFLTAQLIGISCKPTGLIFRSKRAVFDLIPSVEPNAITTTTTMATMTQQKIFLPTSRGSRRRCLLDRNGRCRRILGYSSGRRLQRRHVRHWRRKKEFVERIWRRFKKVR